MLQGLTDKQVREKIAEGKINKVPKSAKTTFGSIVARNVLTIFNLVNVILAGLIIFVGSYRNLLFIVIALANIAIGIFNEVRAKKIIDKLAIVSEKKQIVIRDGKKQEILSEEIVEGDYVVYGLGSQVTVDAEIVEGEIEVNESFVTGESDNLVKKMRDKLVSGSFVVAGNCVARATAVGEANFVNKLAVATTRLKPAESKLFSIINKIIKYISIALIPIGILLLISRLNITGAPVDVAVTSTVASLISMIPEGLVLLTSSVLALAAIRLSKQKVLVQDLYATETLARVDAVCLDKTGTITTGKMALKDLVPVGKNDKDDVVSVVVKILKHVPTDNATGQALEKAFKKELKNCDVDPQIEVIPFSSERKYSGIRESGTEYLMGATEFITQDASYIKMSREMSGRVLAVMRRTAKKEELIGFIVLEDEIRKDAEKILNFFKENEIKIFVISGDGLKSVQGIAGEVGLGDFEGVELLQKTGKINYDELVKKYNIFARVNPAQKKSLVLALKKAGYTVAMTGDGVNDVLAMKEADCSIAIGDGTDAARRVSKLVLMDSDFVAITNIIAEGRQTINNLERSATLFLSKTTYATILSVLFVFLPLTYPFMPIDMSLLNFLCIGFPAFVLALEPNKERIKNRFVNNIKRYSIPVGIMTALSILIIAILAKILSWTQSEAITVATLVVFAIDFYLICRISRPWRKFHYLLLAAIVVVIIGVFLAPFARSFFSLVVLDFSKWLVVLVAIVIAVLLLRIFDRWAFARFFVNKI